MPRGASRSSRSRSPRPTSSATASGSTISIIATAIKVAKADLVGDGKWFDYLDYCDRFYWAVPPHLARLLEEERYLPAEAGLIVADRYDAAIIRDAAHRPLAPARRKAELLHFARRAARRLSAQIDPSLGDAN